jgi:putative membrane protein
VSPPITWSFQPGVYLGIIVVGGWYLHRWRTVRASDGARGAPVWRLACFSASMASVFIALASPVDNLSDEMFLMHMIQHVLVLDIAPVLGLLGFTKALLRPITRIVHDVESSVPWLASPFLAAALYAGDMWAWHIPGPYDYAITHPVVHVLEHMSYLIVGSMYWWHLISPTRKRGRLTGMMTVVYMLSTKVLVGGLAMGIGFDPHIIYTYYAHFPKFWGLSARADQGVGGLIMATEQSIVMGSALAYLFIKALADSEKEEQRRERYELTS